MGMNAATGKPLEGTDHIRQSISDIITTPIGTRIMRRHYGSLVPELIDRPMNDALLMQIYAATIIAVTHWEPRISLTRAHSNLNPQQPGAVVIELEGRTTDGQPISVGVPIT